MIVGYFFESFLGFLFALGFAIKGPLVATKDLDGKPTPLITEALLKGSKTFFECAIYFVISIEISCVIFLVRKDFGINASGLGGLEVQITWAVALLCILPLLYPLVTLAYIRKKKVGFRLFLFAICWLLFFYPCMSMMVGDFAPSQVGEGKGPGGETIIKTDQMAQLTDLCMSEGPYLSSTETAVLNAFGAAGSITVIAYGLVYLLWFIAERQYPKRAWRLRRRLMSWIPKGQRDKFAVRILIFVIPILTVPQIWGVLRIRNIQRSMAITTNGSYTDSQWTFGQVVAVTIFAPVFIEVGYLLMRRQNTEVDNLEEK